MHVCSLQTESRFLTALLFVPLVFKPAKGTLPGVRSKDWDAQYVVQSVPSPGKLSLSEPM